MTPENIFQKYIYLLFSSFIFFNIIKSMISSSCKDDPNISNKDCFNDVIKFDNMKCRAGHSALNKDGAFILQFSNDSETGTRVFYGLKPNGRYYFPNETPTKEITLEKKGDIIARYESMNSFISLKNDINKNKEYFLSISTYSCFMEMYDFTENEVQYVTKYNYDYLGVQIFSFRFELLETKYSGQMAYYLIFCHNIGKADYGDYLSVKKILFSNLDFNTNDIIATKKMDSQKLNDRTVTGFLVDDVEESDFRILVAIYTSNGKKYNYNVYNLDNLNLICERKELFADTLITDGRGKDGKGHGLFFKIIYLGNKDSAIVYFLDNHDDKILRFQSLMIYKKDSCFAFYSKIYMEINDNLKTDLVLNDFIKITDTRLAFISTKGESSLYILLIDLYNNNEYVSMRSYEYGISPYKMTKEFAAHVYNGYLAFSSTVDNSGIFSIFMIFGFANGTDFIFNIFPYLMDTGIYDINYNLVNFLLEHMTIDNNIFGYVPVEEIVLVNYPEEILFYHPDDLNTLIPFGTHINNTSFMLFQNRRLNKTHQLYYIEYQYMVKEQEYDDYSSFANNIYAQKEMSSLPYKNVFSPKTFYGRTIKIAFKLCHDYCEVCNEFGLNNNDQKCFSCLTEYTYDYLALINRFTENCVPFDQLYDAENHELKYCNSTSFKFYYNASRNNERYCFKGDYDCPEGYNYLNETTNECLNYTPPIPTTIPSPIPTTILNKIPTTIPSPIPTTILNKIPTTIPSPIPTTILVKIPTTIPSPIPTTIPSPIPTTITSPISTTIPKPISTTIPKPIPTTAPTTTTITTIPNIITSTKNIILPTSIPKLTTIVIPSTNPIEIPIPTTIPNIIPSTLPNIIPSTILTKIPSTLPLIIPTTLPSKIPSTIPEIIPTTNPTTVHNIITTTIPIIPTTITATIQKIIPPPTIILDKCIYGAVISKNCVFDNMTNNDIANKVKNEVLETYPQDGINIIIPAQDNYAFQLTSSSNELKALNNNEANNKEMSIINLSNCESLLRQHYNISDNSSLIFLKYEKITGIGIEKSIQYEIYNPNTFQKLDLSICEKTEIDISIPITIEEEIKDLYNELKKEGYDLFDMENKFYIDICTPFTAENGADVLLVDRLHYFFSKIVNITTCPSNCRYSTFSIDTKYLSCQCEISNDYIDVQNPEKFLGKLLYDMSDYVLKYTSYKTLKCYKLVFSFKHFIKNAGSIIILILALADIGFMIYFSIKGLSPLKVEISKFFFDEQNIDNKLSPFFGGNINNKKSKSNLKEKGILITPGQNPPKKLVLRRMLVKSAGSKEKANTENKNIKSNKGNIIDYDNKSCIDKDIKNIDIYFKRKQNTDKVTEDKDIIIKNTTDNINNNDNSNNNNTNNTNNKNNIVINSTGTKSYFLNMNMDKKNQLSLRKHLHKIENKPHKVRRSIKNIPIVETRSNKSEEEKPKKKVKFKEVLESNVSMIEEKEPKKIVKENIILDDYEINHLEYLKALELDKRNYCAIYYSILKRDQLIMYTFFSWNDHNLFYIKFSRFIFILCTLMTINAFLFADKSIHKLFLSGVNYYFKYQMLQIVLSIIITYVLDIVLSYLTLTDRHYYEIKSMPKKDNNGEEIFNILKCIRNKLIIFYVITFIILLFYWYSVSAFCAVYPNTQKIFFIDWVLCFIFFSLVPFIVYAITTGFRIMALKCENKQKLKDLYKVSQAVPIF